MTSIFYWLYYVTYFLPEINRNASFTPSGLYMNYFLSNLFFLTINFPWSYEVICIASLTMTYQTLYFF